MSRLTIDDFPLGEWRDHDTRHCPRCGHFPLQFRRYFPVRASGFSLAGGQPKVLAREAWEGRCPACGMQAAAEPRPSRE